MTHFIVRYSLPEEGRCDIVTYFTWYSAPISICHEDIFEFVFMHLVPSPVFDEDIVVNFLATENVISISVCVCVCVSVCVCVLVFVCYVF